MKRYLVTGATGLIGRCLLPLLNNEGSRIFALVRPESRSSLLEGYANVKLIEGDLSDPTVADDLPEQVDTVIHLAQARNYRAFPNHAQGMFDVNVQACFRLLEYARKVGVGNVVLASSGIVYGEGSKPFEEAEPMRFDPHQLGFYYTTKFCAEMLARNYADLLPIIVLRFFFVYGPGQERNMLLPRLVRNICSGIPITLSCEDGITINPIYVTDAAQAVARAALVNCGEVINVAGSEALSLRYICQTIGSIVGKDPVFERVEDSGPQAWLGDMVKMERLLGRASTPIDIGLAKLVDGLVKEGEVVCGNVVTQ